MTKIQNEGGISLFGGVGAGGGDIVGPASSTNNALVRFSGITGKLVQDSANLIFDGTDALTIDGKNASRLGANEFEIFSAADFPAPSAGTITLTSGCYFLRQNITLSDTITVGPGEAVQIVAPGIGGKITYTGTGTLFNSASGADLRLTRIALELSGVGATLFDVTADTISMSAVACVFSNTGQSMGVVDPQVLAFVIQDSSIQGFTIGLTVNGPTVCAIASVLLAAAGAHSGSVLTLADTLNTISINQLRVAAGTGNVFDIAPAFAGVADILSVVLLTGTFFDAGSLDETSPFVSVQGSPPQKSSVSIGSVVAVNNATATVINTATVFEDLNLNAAASLGSNAELWSLDGATTGELTYNGVTPFFGSLACSLSVASAGSTQEFHFRAVKNGAVLPDGVLASKELGSEIGSVSILVPITADPADTIRLQVANLDGTSNVTISQLSMQIS